MNKNIGIKIYNKEYTSEQKELINKLLYRAPMLIEFALFKEELTIEDYPFLNLKQNQIIFHTNYNNFDYYKYIKNKKTIINFYKEIKQAIKLNASKAIYHLEFSDPLPKFNNNKNKILEIYKEIFNKLYKEIPKAKNIIISIENTISDIEWYEFIVLELKKEGFNVGFTLDIGHAKIWSNKNKKEWENILDKLVKNNIPLHFHIHKNNGMFDEHRAIMSDDKNISDNFSKNIIEDIKNLIKKYDKETFIFESQLEMSLKDYQYFVK